MNYTGMTRIELMNEYSDAHKVVYGVRPLDEHLNTFALLDEVAMRIAVYNLHCKITPDSIEED